MLLLLKKNLFVDVLVPVLYLKFEFDWLHLVSISNHQHIGITRMSDDLQLSRRLVVEHNPNIDAQYVSPATHAVVITHWPVKNDSYWEVKRRSSDPSFYPLCFIDAVFEALQILTHDETGYLQILFQPINWTHEYYAYLPALEGICVQKQTKTPAIFDYMWDVPSINRKKGREVGRLLSQKLNSVRAVCGKVHHYDRNNDKWGSSEG